MSRTGLAMLAGVVALGASPPGDAGPRRGKVVRIERPRTGARGTPRICQFNAGDSTGSCFGLPPVKDERGPIVFTTGIVGEVRVTKVEAQTPGGPGASCTEGLWRAELELVEGDRTAIQWGAYVVLDGGLTAAAKLVEAPTDLPSGATGEQAAGTIDRDGNDEADFLVTWYSCPGADPNAQTFCVDYWALTAARWTKLRQDHVSWCN